MSTSTAAARAFEQPRPEYYGSLPANEANTSGVSWAAVLGGAFASASLSLILLSLGAGLGLSSVSPWSGQGLSAQAVGASAIVWLIVMQIMSSGMGGYLAGRLRTKWTDVHTDEVYFRDTAHGFLVWAVGSVVTAAFLATAGMTMIGAGSDLAATADKANSASQADPNGYYVDTLFRSSPPATYDPAVRAEGSRIFASALAAKEMKASDLDYLASMISAKTGISQADARQRITNSLNDARLALDTTRKATTHLLLWSFISMLIGAFCASYAATIGGRQRDHLPAMASAS